MLIAISTLSLAACLWWREWRGSPKEQSPTSAQPITALTVTIDKQTLTLDKNVTEVIKPILITMALMKFHLAMML